MTTTFWVNIRNRLNSKVNIFKILNDVHFLKLLLIDKKTRHSILTRRAAARAHRSIPCLCSENFASLHSLWVRDSSGQHPAYVRRAPFFTLSVSEGFAWSIPCLCSESFVSLHYPWVKDLSSLCSESFAPLHSLWVRGSPGQIIPCLCSESSAYLHSPWVKDSRGQYPAYIRKTSLLYTSREWGIHLVNTLPMLEQLPIGGICNSHGSNILPIFRFNIYINLSLTFHMTFWYIISMIFLIFEIWVPLFKNSFTKLYIPQLKPQIHIKNWQNAIYLKKKSNHGILTYKFRKHLQKIVNRVNVLTSKNKKEEKSVYAIFEVGFYYATFSTKIVKLKRINHLRYFYFIIFI